MKTYDYFSVERGNDIYGDEFAEREKKEYVYYIETKTGNILKFKTSYPPLSVLGYMRARKNPVLLNEGSSLWIPRKNIVSIQSIEAPIQPEPKES